MKRIVSLTCLLILCFVVSAHSENVPFTPHEFFDFKFGMTTEEVIHLSKSKYSVELIEAEENDIFTAAGDHISILRADEPFTFSYGGYPFVSSFWFIANSLSGVHLVAIDEAIYDFTAILTEQDLFLHRVRTAAQFSDIISRLERQYGEPTERHLVTMNEESIFQWRFPSTSNVQQEIQAVLQLETFACFVVKFENIRCYLMQTQRSPSSDLFCLVWIAYTIDESYDNLPVQLRGFEESDSELFASPPQNNYPLRPGAEMWISTKEDVFWDLLR